MLSVVGPLGLAASARTALVVDLVGDLAFPSQRTLADIDSEGPRLDELSPGRRGVAVIGSGPLEISTTVDLIDELGSRWPAVVLRLGNGIWDGPVVPLRPIYPGFLSSSENAAAVWQPSGSAVRPPGPGPVLPRLRPRLARQLLAGRLPGRSHWVESWRRVWDMPWA